MGDIVSILLVTFHFHLTWKVESEKKNYRTLFVKRQWSFGGMLPAVASSESWEQFQG